MFSFADLTLEERLVLVGMLKVVVQADDLYSKEEDKRLDQISEEMGNEVFDAAVAEAARRFKTLEEIRVNAASVERPEARALILETLKGMAGADGETSEETREIDALARLWVM